MSTGDDQMVYDGEGWTLLGDDLSSSCLLSPEDGGDGDSAAGSKGGVALSCDEAADTASVTSSFEPISRVSSFSVDEGVADRAAADTRALLLRFFGGHGSGDGTTADGPDDAALPRPALRASLVLTGPPDNARVKLLLVMMQPSEEGPTMPPVSAAVQQAGASVPDKPGTAVTSPDPSTTTSPPAGDNRGRSLGPATAHLRLLNWLVPGLVALLVGHLAAHTAGGGPGPGGSQGSTWLTSSRGAGPLTASYHTQSGGPLVLGVCSGPSPDAVQLVFTSYAACAGGRGAGCPMAASDTWGGSGWSSEGYSA